MSEHPNGRGVDAAYAIATNEESLALYQRWADQYESDMVDGLGYQYHLAVARSFAEAARPDDTPVLDLGCGTGLLGAALRQRGEWELDGVDLSEAMLAMAARKQAYGRLLSADLNQSLDGFGLQWGGAVSAGTFTHGHLGPDLIDRLVDVLRPGALCCLGVNAEHYTAAEFAPVLESLHRSAMISEPELIPVDIYHRRDHAHGADRAQVVRFRRVGARRD